jgi:hypothetical protein
METTMGMPNAEAMTYLREQAIPLIRDHGWMIAGHTRSELSPGGAITYTAGLTEAGIAELAMTGLPHEPSAVLLNFLARVHLESEFSAGREVLMPNATTLRLVDAPGVIGPIARSLYGARARFLQVLWPDPQGRYPTDRGWSQELVPQPVYSEPLTEYLLPTGDGLVGILDEVEHPGAV